MLDDSVIEKVREGILKRGKLSVEERVEDMIHRGVIDRKGNILLRIPTKPEGVDHVLKDQGASKPGIGKPKKK